MKTIKEFSFNVSNENFIPKYEKFLKKKDVLKLIDEMKVIHEAHYGEDDGTDKIKLVKYLIDKEELKQKIQGK